MRKRKLRKPGTLIRKALVTLSDAQAHAGYGKWHYIETMGCLNRVRSLIFELRASLRASADGKGSA